MSREPVDEHVAMAFVGLVIGGVLGFILAHAIMVVL